ncbi:MAG: GGDEF domain-containing protein [Treponema sp.]|jgi:diguanylate cyclase (GGDEF)-like protein|nr:GGDEF domain-containing protein [Treponema sp.]
MADKEDSVLEHIRGLLKDNAVPKLTIELAKIPGMEEIHNDLTVIREVMFAFSEGDFSQPIRIRGIISGCMKALQARLRHLVWQVQRVEQGDFTQRVEFMGEFSEAFNRMATRLDITIKKLQEKEEELNALAGSLRRYGGFKNTAIEAIVKSGTIEYPPNHDPLTGIMSCRYFMDRVASELSNADVLKIPCGIIMVDIDNFKQFHDKSGSLPSDEALKHTIRLLSSLLRKNDFLGRYGGKTLVFFFSGADEAAGRIIAERMRTVIENNPVKLESGPVPITASFGLAMSDTVPLPHDEKYIEVLLSNAGSALYRAKSEGRNRVVCFSDESILAG